SGGSIPLLSSLPIPLLTKATPTPMATPLAPRRTAQNPLAEQGATGAVAQASQSASGSASTAVVHSGARPLQRTASGSALAVAAAPRHKLAAIPAAGVAKPAPHPVAQAANHPARGAHRLVAPGKLAQHATTAHPKPTRMAMAHPARAPRHHVIHHRRRFRVVRRRGRHFTQKRTGIPTAGSYVVQVGAFSQVANAQRLIASLKAKGYDAYTEQTAGSAADAFYVRSNTVDTRSKADKLSGQFRAAGVRGRMVTASGRFTLDLGTFETQAQADRLVSRLNARGLFATVTSVHHAAKAAATGPSRVLVGRFASRGKAEITAKRLRRELGAAMVVRR
ncbi:MAG: SPOR domain-containing protein, partial [Cyanobacteria bacterium REEB65]|nr:SPOR domain-containing protein [Cyanobacteria bacterium REEB65]